MPSLSMTTRLRSILSRSKWSGGGILWLLSRSGPWDRQNVQCRRTQIPKNDQVPMTNGSHSDEDHWSLGLGHSLGFGSLDTGHSGAKHVPQLIQLSQKQVGPGGGVLELIGSRLQG